MGRIGVFIVLLATMAHGISSASPGPQTRNYDSWRLVAIQDIEPELAAAVLAAYPDYTDDEGELDGSFRLFTLSPDGQTVVVMGQLNEDDTICRYRLDSADVLCKLIEPHEAGFWPLLEHLSWSPDGTQIALHEDCFRYALESDLWLLDVASLTFTNMTDDGVYSSFFNQEAGTFYLDYTPLWNPVTGDLYFFRSVHGEESWSVDLYRLPNGSSTPELARELGAEMPSFTVQYQGRAVMSPDGTQIALAPFSSEPPFTPGLWVIDLDTLTLQPLAVIYGLQVGVPTWVDRERYDGVVSWIEQIAWGADGETLIVKLFNPIYNTQWYVANYLAVSASDGSAVNLADYESYGSEDALIEAVFDSESSVVVPGVSIVAPDGGSLFYLSAQVLRQEYRFMYAAPLPFGPEPVEIGVIPTDDVAKKMLVDPRISRNLSVYRATSNGRALIGTVLLTFE
jgi:hypothetical protein